MLFTTGNLLTLGIVAVMLLLYRALDRGNRSLEKVKKYADKLRDDLDLYVDKRSEDLKRFGIELDVQQKAAREVLKRIQAVEEGLSARAESIGGIERRLGEYDGVLARLMEMTARVDENLVRIQEESEFTEGVARRIEAAQKSLVGLEEELPALREQFLRENRAALDSYKEDMLAEAGRRLAETETRLEKASGEAEAVFQRALEARRDAGKEFERAFERARTEAEKLEDAAFEKLRAGSEAKAARLKETVEEKFSQIGQTAKDKAQEIQGLVKGFKAEWKAEAEGYLEATRAEIGQAAESLGTRLDALETKTAAVEAEVGRRFETVEKRSEELAHGLAEKVKALLTAQKEAFEAKAAEAKTQAAEQLAELGRSVQAAREGAALAGKELAAMLQSAQAETAAAGERLSRQGEEALLKSLAQVERRLAEYGSEVEAKFARLEAVNVDIATLDAALRSAMAEAERRVENEFAAFGASAEERRNRFEQGFQGQMEALKAAMASLEEELSALKTKAYDNVSQKLRDFELEFASDLAERRQVAETRLEAWKAELDRALEELAVQSREERSEAERLSLEELRSRLAETQGRVMEQLETIRQRAEAVQDGIRAQADTAGQTLASLKDAVRKDAEEARHTAQAFVEGEVARLSVELEGRLKTAERRLEDELGRLAAELAAEEARLGEGREANQRALGEFRTSFERDLQEAATAARTELEAWRKDSQGLLESLRTDYERQRDGYIAKSTEERDRLKEELAGLADRTAELRQDLGARISQALDGFSRGYETMLADLQKRQKEAQVDAETRLRGFSHASEELVAKVEASRSQALGKVEAEALRLEQSLAEIDKGMRSFVAQTRLFDQAEELGSRLSASLEAMQADLGRLEARKAEITEIENELARAKRLEDEVNQKLTRFLAEKRRIDALEEDFGRLAAVAQGVDKKLEEVTGQSDALTEAQARIRKVLELSAEAETKYERLEKKTQVLDATADAVDKNFQDIQGLEKLVAALGAEMKRLPERILEIRKSVEELAAGKERAEAAAGKLEELDGIVADAERRIGEAQKAREWLARAETRMEELNRQAQEQLKLLSTLLKEEGVEKRGRGAPPASVQDTVRKLARQGWSADEIARAVKVSRGEVELILELGGKA